MEKNSLVNKQTAKTVIIITSLTVSYLLSLSLFTTVIIYYQNICSMEKKTRMPVTAGSNNNNNNVINIGRMLIKML